MTLQIHAMFGHPILKIHCNNPFIPLLFQGLNKVYFGIRVASYSVQLYVCQRKSEGIQNNERAAKVALCHSL